MGMPQVFWAACPKCGFKFTAEKLIWDRDNPLMCPQCRIYFKKEESPDIYALWPANTGSFREKNK